MWGKNFEFKRKIILQPLYIRIIRCNDDTFVITNQDKKWDYIILRMKHGYCHALMII